MDWKKLLGAITASVDEELRLRNAYLAVENRILRQQLPGRIQLCDSDRKALAEIGQQLSRKALAEVATIAQPATILAWYRTLVVQQCERAQPRKSAGRPRMAQEIEDVVVRMARENRSWGYDRIVGAAKNLGYAISDQTVGNILKHHGIPPAPERTKTLPWREFIRIHLAVLRATASSRPRRGVDYGWGSLPASCSSSASIVTRYVLRPSRHCAIRAGCCPGYGGVVLGTRPQKDGESWLEKEGGHGSPRVVQGSVDRASHRDMIA